MKKLESIGTRKVKVVKSKYLKAEPDELVVLCNDLASTCRYTDNA